jgi:tetratricopeptide (TPR) repeat protein
MLRWQGKVAEAKPIAEEGMKYSLSTGDLYNSAFIGLTLGRIAMDEQNYQEAERYCRQSLHQFETLHKVFGISHASLLLGQILIKLGQEVEATRCFHRSLKQIYDVGLKHDTIYIIIQWVESVFVQRNPFLAVELLAMILHHPFSNNLSLESLEPALTILRSELPPDVYADAWERGKARDLDATVRELLAEGD